MLLDVRLLMDKFTGRLSGLCAAFLGLFVIVKRFFGSNPVHK